MTVIDDRWWMNCKVDGTGVLLHDLTAGDPMGEKMGENMADAQREQVHRLYTQGVEDAGGRFPDYLLKLAAGASDAPGCSTLAARD